MNCLLLDGKRFCVVRSLTRQGRVRMGKPPAPSFPRTIAFVCDRRPSPNCSYQMGFKGAGIAPVKITTIVGTSAPYHVTAKVGAPEDQTFPARIILRNRRIPNRATGHVSFILKWPRGGLTERRSYCDRLESAIRFFLRALKMVPAEDMGAATACFYAAVRKPGGGLGRIQLADWSGTASLPGFLQATRRAWASLPKEEDDQGRRVPV
jgi:hypothetical protein